MRRRERPVLVTGAPMSREEEFNARRKRYLLTMAARIVLLVAAALIAPYSVAAAVAVGALSAILPWLAVIAANDGPPKNSRKYRSMHGQRGGERALGRSGSPLGAERPIVTGTVVTGPSGTAPNQRGESQP